MAKDDALDERAELFHKRTRCRLVTRGGAGEQSWQVLGCIGHRADLCTMRAFCIQLMVTNWVKPCATQGGDGSG